MIRREISTGAAVAAAFLTAGVLSSPTQPPIEPREPVAEVRHDEPVEPPPGYMPKTQPFLSWQPAPSATVTLTWPPSGCDAGMWSTQYELEPLAAGATRVRVTDHRGEKSMYDVPHRDGFHLQLHPTTPQHAWTIATDWQTASFVVRRLENGETTCLFAHEMDADAPLEARATVTADGLTVHALNDEVWAAFELDDACALIGERVIDGALASPPATDFGLGVAGRHSRVSYRFVGDRQLLLTSDEFADEVAMAADSPLRSFAVQSGEDGILVMFSDEQTIHLRVLEHDGVLRWQRSLLTDILREPITHAMLRDGLLSVRGPLDSYHQHKDLVRVFDTHADEVIGEGPAHLLSSEPMVWRWPDRTDLMFPATQSSVWSTDWTSCSGLQTGEPVLIVDRSR